MEELLHSIFANVNDWLKFAEAKNAVFLAFAGAALFSIVQVLWRESNLSSALLLYLSQLVLFLISALVIILTSFIPTTRISWLATMGKKSKEKNLLYFGDIADYNCHAYLDALSNLYGISYDKDSKLLWDYSEQIVVNSRIAVQKYVAFKLAVWMVLAGIITPLPAILLYLFRKR